MSKRKKKGVKKIPARNAVAAGREEEAAEARAPAPAIDANPWWTRPWVPFALIAAVSACAHLWCLKSIFYMDDQWKIRENEFITSGEWWRPAHQNWTYFWWWVQYQLFEKDPMGYHAVNWLLHTGVGCLTFLVGRELFRDWETRGVALGGALIFVALPLGSEVPNYARTQDIAWVVLFSLAACLFVMKGLRETKKSWVIIWFVLAVVMILGARWSKGPGLFHAVMMVGAVFLGCLSRENFGFARRNFLYLAGGAVVVVIAISMTGTIQGFVNWGITKGSQYPIGWHAVTMCRVFWKFVVLFFYPGNLSADHLIAETRTWGDTEAVWAVVGVVIWTVGSLVLFIWKRTRPLGVCLVLFVGAILLRMLFYTNEYMPEYRIYPGLPWMSLAVAGLLLFLWRIAVGRSPVPLFAIIIMVLCVVSARRSILWHRLDDLVADILRQYPAQTRAVWALQKRDDYSRNWESIIQRQRTDFEKSGKEFIRIMFDARPEREYSSGHYVMSEVATWGIYARALAEKHGPEIGMEEIDRLEKRMTEELKLEQELLYHLFRHSKGLVLEKAGDLEGALENFETAGGANAWTDAARVRRLLEERKRAKEANGG